MRLIQLRPLLLGALIAFAFQVFAVEETFTVSRKVLMPDGNPAVGARVIIRTLGGDNGLLQEVETKTGPDGMISATVRYDRPEMAMSPFGSVSNGYLIVDVPGCALAFGKLFGPSGAPRGGMAPPPAGGFIPGGGAPRPPSAGGPPPRPTLPPAGMEPMGPMGGGMGNPDAGALRLSLMYGQTGIVIDGTTNQPVAGATVFPVGLAQSIPVNYFWAGITTKELVAVTDRNGAFTLRGVTTEVIGGMGGPVMGGTTPAGVVAYVTQGDRTLVGENHRFSYSVQPRAKPQEIILQSTVALEGRVVNGVTTQPVAGVQVHLEGASDWVNCLPAVATDATGGYSYPAVLQGSRIYAETKLANYTDGWVLATEGRGGKAEKIAAPDIAIRPMGPLTTVQAVDAKTGQPPVAGLRLTVQIDKGAFDDNLGWIGRQEIVVPMNPDGTAAARMPLGDIEISIFGPGYTGSQTVKVPAEGAVKVNVERRTGILLRFTTTNPNGFAGCGVSVHDGNDKNLPISGSNMITNSDGYWFFELANNPTGPFQVQVSRMGGMAACAWTMVDPNTWPNVIPIR